MSSVSLEKWVALISLVTRCLLGRIVETNETAFKDDPIAASFGRQRFQLGSERNLLISAQPFGLYTKPYPSRFALHSLSPGLFVHIHTSFLGLLSLSSFLHASRGPRSATFSRAIISSRSFLCFHNDLLSALLSSFLSWPAFCLPRPPLLFASYSPEDGDNDDNDDDQVETTSLVAPS